MNLAIIALGQALSLDSATVREGRQFSQIKDRVFIATMRRARRQRGDALPRFRHEAAALLLRVRRAGPRPGAHDRRPGARARRPKLQPLPEHRRGHQRPVVAALDVAGAMSAYPKLYDDERIQRIIEEAQVPPEFFEGHAPGCSFGGFSCLWWLVDETCDREHPNVHTHGPGGFCALKDGV
jgi:hypothetical protein